MEAEASEPLSDPESKPPFSSSGPFQYKPDDFVQPASSDVGVINNTDEDPLHNDRVLLQGLRIAEPGDDGPNTIRKVPSDQLLSMFRWGSSHRMTGRSKSGLQILVPGRETPATVITGGPFSGKSIIYTYASSSDSSGKTTNSYGAVGDRSQHKTGFLSGSKLLAVPEDHLIRPDHDSLAHPGTDSTLAANGHHARVPLTDLIADSTPDIDPYKLFIAGTVGPNQPSARPTVRRILSLRDFPLLPPRRRSLSDLMEDTKALHSPIDADVPTSSASQISTATETTSSNGTHSSCQGISQLPDAENAPEPLKAPTWKRAGPPFDIACSRGAGAHAQDVCLHDGFDPATFCFPYGSKIFVMKSPDIYSLRASVVTGVWSSSKGANKVFQHAWDTKTQDEKIVFLFSISHSHQHSGKYCGMAEMRGPYDPNVDPQSWIEGLKGSEGIIPMRWIVTKDVDFSVFVDLKYKGKFVTELRHANTVPGEAGRALVQAYFETEHQYSSILHPKGQSVSKPSSMPFRTPFKPRKWPAPRTRKHPHGESFQVRPNTGVTRVPGPQTMYGSTVRNGIEMPTSLPFSTPAEMSDWSALRHNAAPGRPYYSAGTDQSMTLSHGALAIHTSVEAGTYFPSMDNGVASRTYPSPAPYSSRAPFDSTSRSYFRVPRTYTSGNEDARIIPSQGQGMFSLGS